MTPLLPGYGSRRSQQGAGELLGTTGGGCYWARAVKKAAGRNPLLNCQILDSESAQGEYSPGLRPPASAS